MPNGLALTPTQYELLISAEQYDNILVKPRYLLLVPSNFLTTANTVNSKT